MNELHLHINNLNNETTQISNKAPDTLYEGAIKSILFSDSILLVSSSNTKADLSNMAFETSRLLETCLNISLPIKGAISFGQFTADFEKSIYFGQPLIDAYILQGELLMYGAIFDHTTEAFLDKHNFVQSPRNNVHIYKVPLKSGKVTHYTSGWLEWFRDHEELLNDINKFYYSVSGQPRVYVDNTVDYINYLISLYEE